MKSVKMVAEIVQRIGAAGVAGDHDPLNRGQVSVDVRPQGFELALEPSSSPSMSICRSVPIRFKSSICRSNSRQPASRTPANNAEGHRGQTRLDVVDGIGAQEIAQAPNEVVLAATRMRRDRSRTDSPFPSLHSNIQGRRTRVRRAQGRGRPEGVRRGRRGRAPSGSSAPPPRPLQLLEPPCRGLHDETARGPSPGPGRLARRSSRRAASGRMVPLKLGPGIGEDDRLRGCRESPPAPAGVTPCPSSWRSAA